MEEGWEIQSGRLIHDFDLQRNLITTPASQFSHQNFRNFRKISKTFTENLIGSTNVKPEMKLKDWEKEILEKMNKERDKEKKRKKKRPRFKIKNPRTTRDRVRCPRKPFVRGYLINFPKENQSDRHHYVFSHQESNSGQLL